MISAEDFALLSHWAYADRIGADVADPDGTATARLADAGYLTPGAVHGMWRITREGQAARGAYLRVHPVGKRVGGIPF
ncbi:hypothetical protein OG455_39190 [Kitasatospora sp. NBC_01287]|uniref:hypothetical protein n=1 Tax=Kitasatospora sp. NBC_01287 TaxID=2903573 RepID=UPI00225C1354|nr:hypothetical protein [Kitasatospora sp. NBC_01287]MCX4751462.1 hypothetical protein [Kitasatospora sp. NBC_01287]